MGQPNNLIKGLERGAPQGASGLGEQVGEGRGINGESGLMTDVAKKIDRTNFSLYFLIGEAGEGPIASQHASRVENDR